MYIARDSSTEVEAGRAICLEAKLENLENIFFPLWHIQVEYKNYFCD